MSSTRFSVVMFSALLSHGGGRETWLNNVLPELLALRSFDQIDVYYVADASTDTHPKIGICSDPRVNFIETRLPLGGGKLTSILRIVVFCINVVKRLRQRPSAGHYVVAVGTFYEGAILALLRATSLHPPGLVIWIRGVWSKEVNHRHGPRVKYMICSFEKLFMRCAYRIISNGQDTKAFYEDLLGRHVEAIPNALDVKKYAAFARQSFSGERKTVSFIGRLSEEKGLRAYLDGIEAYFGVYTSPTLSFDIVGDGPLRKLVEKFVAKFSGYPVRYLGPISNENMLPYLETIDAGVCLTYSKESGGGGVSNGLLELIGAARLVIAWDSPIYKQVLDCDQALFIEENDIAALAQGFIALDARPAEMCTRIARSAVVLERFTLEQHVRHFVSYVRS
jgi:glycosyltransferase involved in cell wall biosynthesis